MALTACDVCHLVLFVIYVFMCVTSATDHVAVTSYRKHDPQSSSVQHVSRRDNISPITHVNLNPPDPGKFSSRLEIFLTDSSTTWLDVSWRLENSSGLGTGESEFSRVRCYHGNLVLMSNNLNASMNHFRFTHLTAETEYMVYVEVLEKVPGDSGETVLHSQGTYFRTIPHIRSDSIVGVILTLGYLLGMGAIGCGRWWWRVRQIKAANQKEEGEYELSCRTSTVRFSGIEEHSHLNSANHEEEAET